MKNTIYYLTFICSLFIMIIYACERTELQKSFLANKEKISNRDECDCPNNDDCCCSVTYLTGNGGTFEICGTTDGDAVTCSVPDICGGLIDGLAHSSFPIDVTNRLELFCMAQNTAFQLALKTGGSVTVVITCQQGQFAPQRDTITYINPGKLWFNVNGDCELSPCN